jgi:sulfur relay (sulfurtransferase) DsrC/TusE family protein
MSAENIVYKADLQRVGSLINESFVVLTEYDKVKDWQQVKEKVISQNLLNKQSSQTVQGIIAAIRKRFFRNHKFLPSAELLAKAIAKNISRNAKIQLLYPYICESDHLVKSMISNFVANKINQSQLILTKNDVLEFLEKEEKTHPELKKWSDYLKGRWTRGFLAFLRDFNIMEKAPSNRLIKPSLRIETFAFFMLGLLDKNLNIKEIFNNEIWHLYFLKNIDIEHFLVEMQARGWIYYSKAGEIIELTPKFNLEGWLNGLE